MIIFPNCKINLGLSVLAKRPDGFHNVETIMYPVPLNDVLEIIPSTDGEFHFGVSGVDISGDRKSNLVVKAYELLNKDFNIGPVRIHLHKTIPLGAGLGGGSADAAYTIILLNQIFNLNLSSESMKGYARQLGSDCAFFVDNKAVFAYDKGDQFKKADIDLPGFFLVIVKPNVHINTAESYTWINPKNKNWSLEEIIQMPMKDWKNNLVNDFEKPIFERFPEIKLVKEKLRRKGAIYASLTGSGAAVYGIFSEEVSVKNEFSGCFLWLGKL
ncbi:MAG: 4-(cytidine 5'-diphospho)-2-C-methyl-D-erythritol kinase [Bacteroidales bacterium]